MYTRLITDNICNFIAFRTGALKYRLSTALRVAFQILFLENALANPIDKWERDSRIYQNVEGGFKYI